MPTTAKTTPASAGPSSGARRTRRSQSRAASLAAQAQRPVLIPIGALLVARERVARATRPYATPSRARRQLSRQLTRLERRGADARDAVQDAMLRQPVVRTLRRGRSA